ncbi:MAG: alpha/beta hydrolase [Nitrospirota bacterium]|nr:alpha/beta hydrolase [Nitrospirota bacterium]MDP2384338.1 alpha/beta hydrolase [Nitrospirota bacterium]
MKHPLFLVLLLVGLLGPFTSAFGGPLRDRIEERLESRRAAAQAEDTRELDLGEQSATGMRLPADARIERDLPYGTDPQQRLDLYIPAQAKAAPIIFMVHGGAWMIGDKATSGFVSNKVAHWLPKGYILVSSNYRMSKRPNPLEQADDIAQALAFVQTKAPSWGGDPARVLLLGHSAGAHLVSLLAADPRIVTSKGGIPWLGTIALDSAAFDLVELMQRKHHGFYDRVFGKDKAFWTETSPYHRLTVAPAPMLLVCSTKRSDACPPAQTFASKATELGGKITVLPVDMKHGELNKELGLPSDYTRTIESFMRTLDLP